MLKIFSLTEPFKGLVDLFFKSSKQKIRKLDQAVTNQDWDSIAFLTHNFKSSAMNLGLVALEEQAQQLEDLSRAEDAENTVAKFYELQNIYETSQQALREYWETLNNPGRISIPQSPL